MASSRPLQQPPPPRADIAVLTVIPAELFAALAALGLSEGRLPKDEMGTIAYRGGLRSHLGQRDYELVLTCIGRAGNSLTAAAVQDVITRYRPRAVLLMGIAAGIRGKVRIGDVVFSERVVAYEPAAVTRTPEGSTREEPRPEIRTIPYRMQQDVVHYRLDESRWEERFKKLKWEFPQPPSGSEALYQEHVATRVTVKGATIASGEKLLRDPSKLREIRSLHGRVEVGEMESVGFMEACERNGIPWLVVRGISDFGDEFKDDRFHDFASRTAATILADFLEHGLELSATIEAEPEAGRGGSDLEPPRKVVALGHTGMAVRDATGEAREPDDKESATDIARAATAARLRKIRVWGGVVAAVALTLAGMAVLEFQPCRQTREVSAAELVLEAQELFSFDLEALNRVGIERLTAGGVNHRVPPNGLESLEIRSADAKKPVRLSLRVAANADGQQLHVQAEPGGGTLQVRLQTEDGALEESQGPVDIYLDRRTSILLAGELTHLEAVKGTNACWTRTDIKVLQWDGDRLVVRR